MAKMLKAIPTTYRGIEFRSKLEAKYAQAFDRLGIVWEYEGHGFAFDDGTWYCPDFYMPEIDTYFEVKGVMDEWSIKKINLLANEVERVFVGAPNGDISCPGEGIAKNDYGMLFSGAYKCKKCGRWFFSASEHPSICGKCGERFYIREGEVNEVSRNVFEAAGWGNVR